MRLVAFIIGQADTEGGGSPPRRAPAPPALTGDGGRVKSAELRAFIRDTPGIGVRVVATIAVMRNFHILLSASAQIAPLGSVISWFEKDSINA